MEQSDTLTLDPVAEAEDSPPESFEESASQPVSDGGGDISPASRAQMNALIRGQVAAVADGGSTSKPDDDGSESETEATGGESASAAAEGVKPPAAGQQPGRRGAAAEIERLNGEVERLTKALDDLKPAPPPDPSDTARTQAIERENRYRTLLVKPETDADWTSEDIQFLESEKQRRAIAPELQQHYDTVLAAEIRQVREAGEAERADFWTRVRADLATAKDVPGVDFEAVKAATTFAERDRLMYRAGAASNEPELKKLREEVADLRRDLYGTARAPLNGGRSSPGRTYSENDFMNTLIRGGRRAG